jgi:cytoskeletal protein RodZ
MIGINPKTPGNGQDRADSAGRKSPAAASSIGAALRERREALGATLAEVEAATKIRQKYLSALEADEWQLLPGEVVGRGFLRNYASYLGLDATDFIERRRAVADPSLSNALSVTSAGSQLPPMRAVDYRPKDVDLREEPATLEERTPPRLGRLLVVVAAIVVLGLAWWGLSRWGGAMLDGISSAAERTTDTVSGLFAARPDATPTPSLAVVADPALAEAPTATSTSVFLEPLATALPADVAPLAPPAEGGLLLPTATPQGAVADPNAALVVPAATPTIPAIEAPTATPTAPAPAAVTVNALANLRAAPNVEATLAGSAEVGQAINLVGRTADGLWYLLDSGGWIYSELVTGAPADLPVAEPTSAPEGALIPTATPEATPEGVLDVAPPAVVQAVCADPRVQITSPGQSQVVSGLVAVLGTATHESFSSYKIEAGAPDGALAFIGSGNVPVSGGVLGTLDSATFGNGPLLIRVTVIDQSSNFPPPCDVTVTVQN